MVRNLARRLDQQWPGVAASILEGLDEILTVVRLKLPKELRRSLACTNIAENMMGTIRRVTRNVKRLGLLQGRFAGEDVRPWLSGQDVIEEKEFGFPAVRKANLEAAGLRHGFVPDDADAAGRHQN